MSPAHSMFGRLASLAIAAPRRVLALALLTGVAALVIGYPVANELKTSLSDYDNPSSESAVAQRTLGHATGVAAEPAVIAIVHAPRQALAARAGAVEQAASTEPLVARVEGMAGNGTSRQFESRTGTASYVAVYFRRSSNQQARAAASRLQARLRRLGDVVVGGPVIAEIQLDETVKHDLRTAELVGFPIVFVLLLLVFRGLFAATLPLLVAGGAIAGGQLSLRLLDQFTAVSAQSLTLVSALGLGLGVDYSLLILSRYREENQRNGNRGEALAESLRTAGHTVLFSAVTVGLALASLLAFPQRYLYSIGAAGVLATFFAAFVALTVLPSLIMLLGKRLDARPVGRRVQPGGDGLWPGLARSVTRRPAPIAIVTLVVLAICSLPLLHVRFAVFKPGDLPPGTSARSVATTIAGQFPSGKTSDFTAVFKTGDASAPPVQGFARHVAKTEGIVAVVVPHRVGPETSVMTAVAAGEPLGGLANAALRRLRTLAEPAHAAITGPTAIFRDRQASLGAYLPLVLALVAVTTFLTLFVLTQSLVLPIETYLLNIVSLSAALGIVAFVFQDGRLESLLSYTAQGAIDSPLMTLLCVLAFALTTDYGIFLLSRIKEAHDRGTPTREAIVTGMGRTGGVLTAAALILAVALGANVTSRLIFVKEFAVGAALAVLIDATVVRAFLVPSLMSLLGERNWWAPRRLRRVLARLPDIASHRPGGQPEAALAAGTNRDVT